MRRRATTALLALLLAIVAVGAPAAVARAAAPPPALDACLDGGSFNIAERECQLRHAPTFGDQFGPIGSVVTHVAKRGDTITLGFNPGDDIFYDRPISCGDAGCIYHGIFWRPQDDQIRATWMERLDGCGGADQSCSFRVWPDHDMGDDSEKWLVVYAQHYRGIFPQQGVAHAIYVPPRFYPVRVDSVDASGAAVAPRPGDRAYAVRAGRSAGASACAAHQWFSGLRRILDPPLPDCVILEPGPDELTGAPGWGGYLPVDSGDWTIVAAPAGLPDAALTGRPSPYRAVTVTPVGDDLHVQAVEVPRPRLVVTVEPELPEMALGTTQDVQVTVAAAGGEAGSLTLDFADPGVLSVADADPPVLLPGVPGDPAAEPNGPFTLAPGTERAFVVRVNAVGVGDAGVEAIVTGTDDVDRPVVGDAAAVITVVEGSGEGTPGAEAIAPPIVDRATAAAPGSAEPGTVDGTATGTPGGTMTVTIWTSSAASGTVCSPRTSGPGVQLVGSTELTLGEDGTAPFAFEAPLTAGWFAYGLASVGSQVSKVGDCTVVAADMPTVSIADAAVLEGTAGSGATALDVTVSLSQPSDLPVTVRIATADGSATSPADYASIADREITFAPGVTAVQVTIDVVPDADQEDDETVDLVLADPVNGRLPADGALAVAKATATIADDDTDAVTETADVRGTWSWSYRQRFGGKVLVATYTMTITRQDPDTGKVTGRMVVDSWDPYPTYRGKVSGTVTGDEVHLKVTGTGAVDGPIDGTLVRRNGKLAIRQDQSDGKVTFVLTDPARP